MASSPPKLSGIADGLPDAGGAFDRSCPPATVLSSWKRAVPPLRVACREEEIRCRGFVCNVGKTLCTGASSTLIGKTLEDATEIGGPHALDADTSVVAPILTGTQGDGEPKLDGAGDQSACMKLALRGAGMGSGLCLRGFAGSSDEGEHGADPRRVEGADAVDSVTVCWCWSRDWSEFPRSRRAVPPPRLPRRAARRRRLPLRSRHRRLHRRFDGQSCCCSMPPRTSPSVRRRSGRRRRA